jgi:hypothetical protein
MDEPMVIMSIINRDLKKLLKANKLVTNLNLPDIENTTIIYMVIFFLGNIITDY